MTFQKAQGLNQWWYKDTATTAIQAVNHGFAAMHAYLIKSPTVKGTFSFRIPLKHVFGFCEFYDKIVHGLKHSLTLVRKTDDDAIFRGAATDAGKWFIPRVIAADAEKFLIYKIMESKVKLLVAYRTR